MPERVTLVEVGPGTACKRVTNHSLAAKCCS